MARALPLLLVAAVVLVGRGAEPASDGADAIVDGHAILCEVAAWRERNPGRERRAWKVIGERHELTYAQWSELAHWLDGADCPVPLLPSS